MASPARSSTSDTTVYAHTSVRDQSLNPLRLAKELVYDFTYQIIHFTQNVLLVLYIIYQRIISLVFTSGYRPFPAGFKPHGRVAIIGAGITGVSSAAHLRSHGFDVVIFDAKGDIGGVWANVNSTSCLQLNSLMFRFFPSIIWKSAFPKKAEILNQLQKVFDDYHLEECTHWNTSVKSVTRHQATSTSPRKGGHARWVINNDVNTFGIFDAVIGSIGSCGAPRKAVIPGHEHFKGGIYHSSDLDNKDFEGKSVVIIGSGASGVEAAELAVLKKAGSITLLARDDKWFIPRNTAIDIALSLKPYGAETRLSWIPEQFIRWFHYGDQADLSPATKGLFEGTPIVNNEFLQHTRAGLIQYRRGDTEKITAQGVKFNERERGSKSGDKGVETVIKADIIVMATGYARPSVDILPLDLFPTEGDRVYKRPNLYIQNFSTEDWSVLLTNAAYTNAIGSVGSFHIGIYARILAVFLLDPSTRPSPVGMKTWVDVISWLKLSTFGSTDFAALDFFTYAELLIFVLVFHFFSFSRLKWMPFVLFGFGVHPPQSAAAKRVN